MNQFEVCARKLKAECYEFDFGLDSSFRYSSDSEVSLHVSHSKFFQADQKEIVFNMIHNGQKKTPSHTAIAQSIHNTCKSKKFIQIMNSLGLSIVTMILNALILGITQHTIQLAGNHRVPIVSNITS